MINNRIGEALSRKQRRSTGRTGLKRQWYMVCEREYFGFSEVGCRHTELIDIIHDNELGVYDDAVLKAYSRGWVNENIRAPREQALWLCPTCHRRLMEGANAH